MDKLIVTIKLAPVASAILAVTLATSLAAFQNQFLKEKFVLRPYAFVHRKQYWTVITSGLIHGDYRHLLFNVIAFYFFAFDLEKWFVLQESFKISAGEVHYGQTVAEIIGHAKFFFVYFFSMVIADLTTIVKYKDIPSYASLGASGAISGVVMAAVIITPAMGNEIMIWGIIPGWAFGVIYILGSYFQARYSNDNVGHEAHLWGAIAGIVMMPVFYPKASWQFVQSVADVLPF